MVQIYRELVLPSCMNPQLFFERADPAVLIQRKSEGSPTALTPGMANAFGVNEQELKRHAGGDEKTLSKEQLSNKNQLVEYLEIIYEQLMSQSLAEDEKLAIKEKLKEGVETCTPGFADRIQEVVKGFAKPKTVPELLTAYRGDILNKARSIYSGVHTYQQFYEIANQMGLGMPVEGIKDIYRGELSDAEVQDRIISFTNVGYTPARIAENLFKSVFAELGYSGKKDEGYEAAVYQKIFSFFNDCIGGEKLSYDDVFILDDENHLIDINWMQIISHLIHYFLDNKYLEFKESTQLAVKPGELKLIIDANDPAQTLLVVGKTMLFLGNARHFAKKKEINSELLASINKASIAKATKRDLLFQLYLSGFDISIKDQISPGYSPTFIKDGLQLSAVLQDLNEAQCATVVESLQKRLPELIKNGSQLSAVLRYLTKERCATVFKSLPALIKDANQLGATLRYLTVEECKIVCEVLKGRLPTLIKDANQLSVALRYLTVEECKIVCEVLKGRLPILIKNVNQLGDAFRDLTEEQCRVACEALKEHLPTLIEDKLQLVPVLQNLTTGTFRVVCEALEKHLLTLIENHSQFRAVLQGLTPVQCEKFCEALKDHLPALIKTIGWSELGIDDILDYLTRTQRAPVFRSLLKYLPIQSLPILIKNGAQLGEAFGYLTEERRVTVFKFLQEHKHLPTIIKNGRYLGAALEHLTENQRTTVFESLKKDLRTLIKDGGEFGVVSEYLTEEQRITVFESLKENLPTLIEDGNQLSAVLQYLPAEQYTTVFDTLKDHLQTLIENGDQLVAVLKCFRKCPATTDFEPLKKNLVSLVGFIENGEQWGSVFEQLPEELRTTVFDSRKGRFSTLIKGRFELSPVLKHLTVEQCKIVCEDLKKDSQCFSNLIEDGFQLPDVLICLDDEQKKKAVSEILLPIIIKDRVQQHNNLEGFVELNEEQRTEVYTSLKKQLPTFIENGKQLANALKYLKEEEKIELVTLLGRKRLKSIISKDSTSDDLKDYRSVLLSGYKKMREKEKEYFWPICKFFQHSKTSKLQAVENLREKKDDSAGKQGLLGKINRATR